MWANNDKNQENNINNPSIDPLKKGTENKQAIIKDKVLQDNKGLSKYQFNLD